jgi:tRNA splicing endonuclease
VDKSNIAEAKLYYTAPSDEQFAELKEKAIALWSTMGDEPSYREEKIGRIKDIENVQDNFMYMVAMFDINNQRKLAETLSAETRLAVRERMIDGGNPEYLIPF